MFVTVHIFLYGFDICYCLFDKNIFAHILLYRVFCIHFHFFFIIKHPDEDDFFPVQR